MKFVIIDGNAIIHRGYHAIPPLTTKDGQMVNAVYGFTSMLLKVWNQLKPEYLAVTFDLPGKTFRHEKFEDYKATRVKADPELYQQVPLTHELVEAFNIPIYEKAGYEADDVIGTIVKQVRGPEVYIVTGDMDTLQLVDGAAKVYTLRKGLSDIVIYDSDKVKERYGFGPEMIVDFKALRGDASDNIPGVAGIGEKTATELIQKIGGVEEIYKQVQSPKSKVHELFKEGVIKKLEKGEEDARLSKELATIDCDVPKVGFKLEDCVLQEYDIDKVVEKFKEFEFSSLVKRIPGLEPDKAKSLSGKSKTKSSKNIKLDFTEVKTTKEAEQLGKLIKKEEQLAARALVSGQDIFSDKLAGLVLVVAGKGFYVEAKLAQKIWVVFADKQVELVGHDLKQLIKILKLQSVEVKNKLFDTMLASYLLNPGTRSHDLASVVLRFLGKELVASSNQGSLFGEDPRQVAQELHYLNQITPTLKAELEKVNNLGLLETMEMPLETVLAEVELNGIAIDDKMLTKLAKEGEAEVNKLTKKIHQLAGEEFNIASPIQLREVLFEK